MQQKRTNPFMIMLESKIKKCQKEMGKDFGFKRDDKLYCGCSLDCKYQKPVPYSRPLCEIYKDETRPMARRLSEN